MPYADASIAGAGIIGLAAALELASAGLQVTVFERNEAMRESSWAAAGMFAATDPENPAALRSLSALSAGLYPQFLSRIEALSGIKAPIRTHTTLQGAHILPVGAEPLGKNALEAVASGLKTDGLKFFRLEEQSLDPRDLARALPQAVKAAGIRLFEHAEVTAVLSQPGSVTVQTTQGDWTAEHFINACGAWASNLADAPVFPRKGQILLVDCPQPLTAVIRTPELYLVPRGDGHIVIGATVEDAGFDRHIDSSAINALYRAAAALWPPVHDARILDMWTGLRPATSDSLPIIGPLVGFPAESSPPRSWLALGHFRNGILLAPGTARLLRQMILNEPLSADSSPFTAGRFLPSFAK